MDLSKLTMGSKIVIGGGVLLLIDSFLHWQEVSFGPISAGVSMWHGWGILIGLLLLAILAWEAVQLVNRLALGPLSPSMVTASLSVLLVLFTVLKVLTNDFVAARAWIGLVLSAGIVAGAWLNMKTAGESISDLKTSVTAATSSATTAAKAAAAARSDGTSAPAASSPDPTIETAAEPSGSGDTMD